MSFRGNEFFVSHRRLRKPSYTFKAFTIGNISTTYTESFTRGGIYPCLLLPDTYFHFYVCNRATLLDIVQRYRVHQSITKHSVIHIMQSSPMSCDVPLHNTIRCATTCLCHATYVMHATWTTQTTKFIMCHGNYINFIEFLVKLISC